MEGASWIRRRNDNQLTIHPLIRQIFKNELQPQDSDCAEFLATLWAKFEFRYPQEVSIFRQAAELFKNAVEFLQDKAGDFAYRAGHCSLVIRKFSDARRYSGHALKIQFKKLSPLDMKLAPTLNDVAAAAIQLFDTAEAFNWLKCASVIGKEVSPQSPYLADTYFLFSEISLNDGDFDGALKFAEEALKILQNQPAQFDFKLAAAHNELGNILKKLGRYDDALKHLELAAEIYKRLAHADNPDLAVVWRNIAQMHVIFGKLETAAAFIERAIFMQEKILPPTHMDLFISYHEATRIFTALKDFERWEIYQKKFSAANAERAQKTWMQMLQLKLHILASAKNSSPATKVHNLRGVADAYQYLKDFERAEKYIVSAINEIANGVEDVAEIFLTYFTASQIYRGLKNFEIALLYAQDSLAFVEKNFAEHYGNLSTCNMQLGILYDDLNLKAEAQIYYRRGNEFDLLDKAVGKHELRRNENWRHINEL